MALTKPVFDTDNISSLSTTPNITEGLTALQLQELFDKVGVDIKSYLTSLTTEIDNLIYPIGSIYFSVNNVNPDTFIPNTTWVAFGVGKTIVGVDISQTEFNTVEKTGGAKTVTLTQENLPASIVAQGTPASAYGSGTVSGFPIKTVGNATPVSVVQPYITLYMFKRTA